MGKEGSERVHRRVRWRVRKVGCKCGILSLALVWALDWCEL